MNNNIFVTGGAGYIGSHACKALQSAGFNPICIDNLSTGWEDAVQFGPFEHADLLDKKLLEKLFCKYKPRAVMHFAALSLVGESVEKPAMYWRNNVIGSLNLIETAVESGCLDFIFSSTCATYGDHDGILLTETTQQNPVNAYGASKKAVEDIIFNFAQSFGLRYAIFRYFNVAGASNERDIGEFHIPETHLIPIILEVINGKREKLVVHGTDYETHDGTCVRDYVHVTDLVYAHLLGLRWLINGSGKNQVFNLGTGHGFTVFEVIEAAKRITNRDFTIEEGPRRDGDATCLVSGSQMAKDVLGWFPKRSNLDSMIDDAWQWQRNGFYQK